MLSILDIASRPYGDWDVWALLLQDFHWRMECLLVRVMMFICFLKESGRCGDSQRQLLLPHLSKEGLQVSCREEGAIIGSRLEQTGGVAQEEIFSFCPNAV